MKKLKKTLLLAAFCLFGLFTIVHAQNKKISIKISNGTLSTLIKDIESKTAYTFFINEGQIDVNSPINDIDVDEANVDEALLKALAGTDYYYQIDKKQILVKKGEQITISGIITDVSGGSVIGASVVVKDDASRGTVTDLDGRFSLKVFRHSTIIISYLGYTSQELPIKGQTEFKILLKEDAKLLGEVVVTALGIKREEKSLGYSVSTVKGEELTKVKGVNVATSLTGKVAGVYIQNSTEFGAGPTIQVRGKAPFVVIDGVPYAGVGLSQIPADDIADINILKGSTAAALYGARADNGVIMITTKRGGEKEGLDISVNSNTMFNAGHLKLPEAQSSYSSGNRGVYNTDGYVWGAYIDGQTVSQYNPYTQKKEDRELKARGKNNLKNFMQQALVTNNNLSVGYKSDRASFRSSLTHVYNKGQFPNLKSNKVVFAVSGDMKFGDLKLDAALTTSYERTPQDRGAGYGSSGHIYNLLVWNGTEYDIRDYKNYWVPGNEHEKQNWWHTSWFDNPYFVANENRRSNTVNRTFGHINATYDLYKGLKAIGRVGYDTWSQRNEDQMAMSTRGYPTGSYSINNNRTHGINADLMLMADYKLGDFNVDGMFGGSIYFRETDYSSSATSNGLLIPGYYSLKSSVDKPTTSSSLNKEQINSLYGKIGLSWKSAIFMDITGRNDWSSRLDKAERSYFYPSVGGSVVLSEFMPLEDWGIDKWFNFWKVRGSWTVSKRTPSIYEINNVYSITNDAWNGYPSSSYPTVLKKMVIKPTTKESWEVGTGLHFFQGRLHFDFAYYQEHTYNMQRNAGLAPSSGFSNTLVNYDEELMRKGMEFSISGDIIQNKDFSWNSSVNWSRDRYYYHKVDDMYSTKLPWLKAGARWDWFDGVYDWERDPEGNIALYNGMPRQMSTKNNNFHTSSDWIWGWSNNFKYKDFSFSLSIDGRIGGYAWDRTSQAMYNAGSHPNTDNEFRYKEVVDGEHTFIADGMKVVSGHVVFDKDGGIVEDSRVFAPNDIPVSYQTYMMGTNPYSMTYQNIKEATFVKLRELSVGYNVPKNICQKIKLDNAYVALVGQNLWMWSKNFKYSDVEQFDPSPTAQRDALTAPSIRYIGINFKFGF